jgi:hypothetical protein
MSTTETVAVAVTILHAWRLWKDFAPHRAALSQQYNVINIATLRVLSCFYSHGSDVCDATVYGFAVTLKHAIWWRQVQCSMRLFCYGCAVAVNNNVLLGQVMSYYLVEFPKGKMASPCTGRFCVSINHLMVRSSMEIFVIYLTMLPAAQNM